ncbi:MAG: hypothetical protein VKO21_10435 [Candidatus Sericytochromatia bacterium]|nr:hypothetical protein [Candidatus Sericytochromatia bacterium]
MGIGTIICAGLAGTAGLNLVLGLARAKGLTTLDFEWALGHLLAPGRRHALLTGAVAHHLEGIVFAACYAWIWHAMGLSMGPLLGITMGSVLGVYHGLLHMPLLALVQWTDPASRRGILPDLGLLRGSGGLVETTWRLLAHVAYGGICGLILTLGRPHPTVWLASGVAAVLGIILAHRRHRHVRPGSVLFLRGEAQDREALARWSSESPAAGRVDETEGEPPS